MCGEFRRGRERPRVLGLIGIICGCLGVALSLVAMWQCTHNTWLVFVAILAGSVASGLTLGLLLALLTNRRWRRRAGDEEEERHVW